MDVSPSTNNRINKRTGTKEKYNVQAMGLFSFLHSRCDFSYIFLLLAWLAQKIVVNIDIVSEQTEINSGPCIVLCYQKEHRFWVKIQLVTKEVVRLINLSAIYRK